MVHFNVITNIKFSQNLINSLEMKYNKCKCISLMHAHTYTQVSTNFSKLFISDLLQYYTIHLSNDISLCLALQYTHTNKIQLSF